METVTGRKAINDIKNRIKEFNRIEIRTHGLIAGFQALAKELYLKDGNQRTYARIRELQDNINYRLFCSLYHWQLLIQVHDQVAEHLRQEFMDDPKSFDQSAPKHKEYGYAERQASALFDSLVYHLTTIYDYTSVMINFIATRNKSALPKWTKLCELARRTPDIFTDQKIVEVILTLNQFSVDGLYGYRSRLIHERPDISRIIVLSPSQTHFDPYFVCSEGMRKLFKRFIVEQDAEYTITFIANILVLETIQHTATIVQALRRSIWHGKHDESHIDRVKDESNSEVEKLWSEFEAHFNIKLD